MKKIKAAILGSTGNVGREIISLLAEWKSGGSSSPFHSSNSSSIDFPFHKLFALSSDKSLGKEISYGNSALVVDSVDYFDFSDIDIIFSAVSSDVLASILPKINKSSFLIDKSEYFRHSAPLIVPEINWHLVNADNSNNCTEDYNVVSSPNCCVIPIVLALNKLNESLQITKIVTSTYQSVSGAGKKAMDDLYGGTKAKLEYHKYDYEFFTKDVAFNVLPCIGEIDQFGNSSEETKVSQEIKTILNLECDVIATCVRVPTFIGHGASLYIEFEKQISSKLNLAISNQEGVKVLTEALGATTLDASGKNTVLISRIRKHSERSMSMWVSCDNLRKGAALNALQISQRFISELSK
jgi:aspartate-semialdehyde dehydrogenase